jgi:hypothetical protein
MSENICSLVAMIKQIKYFQTAFQKADPVNPFLFIRGLSCPGSVQTSLTQNWLKLSIHGFPYNCLLVSCGEIGF